MGAVGVAVGCGAHGAAGEVGAAEVVAFGGREDVLVVMTVEVGAE